MPPADRAAGVRGRRVRRRRFLIAAVVLVVVVALGAGAVAIWRAFTGSTATVSRCRVAVGAREYLIDVDQAANATTITTVAKRLGLPDHAVTIALAAALQESKLHNLRYGDRDSLGLFQQRPSQGWGTPAQLTDPAYAAAAFFRELEHVSDWQTRSVTDAAQAVQRSNAPQAYASWEPLARTLAIAATGERPAALSCQFPLPDSNTPAPSPMPTLTQQLGPAALGTPVATARGWTIASWLVAHAVQYRITSVRFAAREWTPRGEWRAGQPRETGVQITQSPVAP